MWIFYALLAAVFAAGVAVFGKIGMRDIDPDLATGARSLVQAGLVVALLFVTGASRHIGALTSNKLALTMVLLSGMAGGLSWICGFRALKLAEISQVGPLDKLSVPIAVVVSVLFLGDRPSGLNWVGIVLIVSGAFLTAIPRA